MQPCRRVRSPLRLRGRRVLHQLLAQRALGRLRRLLLLDPHRRDRADPAPLPPEREDPGGAGAGTGHGARSTRSGRAARLHLRSRQQARTDTGRAAGPGQGQPQCRRGRGGTPSLALRQRGREPGEVGQVDDGAPGAEDRRPRSRPPEPDRAICRSVGPLLGDTCCVALECRAPEADASGPLHKATVAAREHRMPAAITRPGWFLMGPLCAPNVWRICGPVKSTGRIRRSPVLRRRSGRPTSRPASPPSDRGTARPCRCSARGAARGHAHRGR